MLQPPLQQEHRNHNHRASSTSSSSLPPHLGTNHDDAGPSHVYLSCSQRGHYRHGPYYFSRQDVESSCRWLASRLPSASHIIIDDFDNGNSCGAIMDVIQTLRESRTAFQPASGVDRFEHLVRVARALVHLECAPHWYQRIAEEVLKERFEKDHKRGEGSQDWAFLSFVFGWVPEFGLAAMDVPQLAPNPPSAGTEGPVQELTILRSIITPELYESVNNEAVEFMDGKIMSRMQTTENKTKVRLAHSLAAYYEKKGYDCLKVVRSRATTHPSTVNLGPLTSAAHTPVSLFRTFHDFIDDQANVTATHRPIRAGPKTKIWSSWTNGYKKKEEQEQEQLRKEVASFYDNTFRNLLARPGESTEQYKRFTEARQQRLLLMVHTNGARSAELSTEPRNGAGPHQLSSGPSVSRRAEAEGTHQQSGMVLEPAGGSDSNSSHGNPTGSSLQ